MSDDLVESGGADASPLKVRIDHESPQRDFWVRRRLGSERFVVEHHEAGRGLIGVDGPIPCVWTEKSLCERDGVAGDEALLIRTNGEVRNLANGTRSYLAKRGLHSCSPKCAVTNKAKRFACARG